MLRGRKSAQLEKNLLIRKDTITVKTNLHSLRTLCVIFLHHA
jgi:hypothetical protein